MNTIEIEQSSPETVGSGQFQRFHESGIPVHGFGDRIHPIPPGTWQNQQPETVRFLRISARSSRNTASGIIDLGRLFINRFTEIITSS